MQYSMLCMSIIPFAMQRLLTGRTHILTKHALFSHTESATANKQTLQPDKNKQCVLYNTAPCPNQREKDRDCLVNLDLQI